ncbi:MAG: PEP-CTERM sorting domain-containing protein [Phycisphaerales bacterium]|nr:MAG: PEP-CTERM sorting domain-containing protein [Phycisphaerales bacterium]
MSLSDLSIREGSLVDTVVAQQEPEPCTLLLAGLGGLGLMGKRKA